MIGLLIGAPVLRLRGDYLAIVTLGFGEIIRILVTERLAQADLWRTAGNHRSGGCSVLRRQHQRPPQSSIT